MGGRVGRRLGRRFVFPRPEFISQFMFAASLLFRKDGDRQARMMIFAEKTLAEASKLRRQFPERVHIVPLEGLTEWATGFFQDLHYRVLLRPRRAKAPPAYNPNLARNAGSREQGLRK